ncbi:hypothetical protein [Hymenobacter bucti]|uniref:Lipoprotein n=1 Tax=Hymenobacter bucti TaxID=1844114 RepID=A0ABW4QUD5_9BACT
MKKTALLPLGILLLAGCQNQEREQRLQKKEAELAHREQELLLREKALTLREQADQKAQQAVDSVRGLPLVDTALVRLAGTWATRMNCIETDCAGSAIGDSKNEQWEFSTEQGQVLVRASVGSKVVRVYSGRLQGSELLLTAQHQAGETLPDAIITAQLQLTADQRLEGRREINRPDNCRIVYALTLTRAPQPLLSR